MFPATISVTRAGDTATSDEPVILFVGKLRN